MPLVDMVVGLLAAFATEIVDINVPVKIVEKPDVPVKAKAITFLVTKRTLKSPLELLNF
ncbi:MAG: hypothetical protein KME01_05015 [Chroococcus sp. CMT-3BRIN-NPC107]|nr:hypothetical protein [Chroococcus sp. CMT-3BRIN-NPC107]